MERKKIDELWRRQDVRDAEAILGFYLNEEAKVIFVSSGEKYDSVPNHQAVTDMNADAKTLRIGTAWAYCHYCKCGVKVLKSENYLKQAQYLHDYYFIGNRYTTAEELRRLHYSPSSRSSLMGLLPEALYLFAQKCPQKYFQALLKYEVNNNKYDEPNPNNTSTTNDNTIKTK